MQIPFAVLLAALLLVVSRTDKCNLGPAVKQDQIESGSTLIQNGYSNDPNKRYHSYTFTVSFTVPFSGLKVSASASSLQATTPNGLDFHIWGNQGSYVNTGTIALLIDQYYTWSSIRVHYFVSGRNDNYLGTFLISILEQQQTVNTQSIVKYYALPGWTSTATNTYSPFAKIAGITTTAPSFMIALTDIKFDPASGIFSIFLDLKSTSGTIKYLTITYLLFSNYIHASTDDYTPERAQYAPYQFVGLQKIQNGQGVVTGRIFNIQSSATGYKCLGHACPSPCITSQFCSANNGPIWGNSYCYICSSKQTYDGNSCQCNTGLRAVKGKDCLPNCGLNSYLQNSICKVDLDCTTMSNPQNLVQVSNRCICPSGFCILNNVCIPLISLNYADDYMHCKCPNGYTQNVYTGICSLPGTVPSFTSVIALKNSAIGYSANTLLYYKGVTMTFIPVIFVTIGPPFANKLLIASANTKEGKVITNVQYLPNYQYRFVVTFSFSQTNYIPSFQYTIKINPQYASYFTAIDMQQSLTGTYIHEELDPSLGVPPIPAAALDQPTIDTIFSNRR